jgi:hypothetical protein
MQEEGSVMWVFDGEEWTEEGGGSGRAESQNTVVPRFDEFQPELQIIEIVPVPERPSYIPVPLP